jgi:hypothetical protein
MAARHHHKHISMHDREQDRENLMHRDHMMKEKPSRRMHDGHYADEYARRTQQMEDAGMIHEDMRQIANLPQEVMMKPYPTTGPDMPQGLDDTIRGVDRQMDYDNSKRQMHNVPKKV